MAQIKFISRPALLAAGCLFLLSAAAVFAAGEPQVKEEDLRVVSPVSGGGSPGQELKPFREGELWGFKNAAGETAVAPVFDRAEDFREGLAPVLLHGKWGYLDGAGRMALEPRYDGWNHFSGGQALVKLNGEWVTIKARRARQVRVQGGAGLFQERGKIRLCGSRRRHSDSALVRRGPGLQRRPGRRKKRQMGLHL